MIIRKAIRSDGGITGTLKKQTPLNKKIKGVKTHSSLLRNSGKKEKEYIHVFGCYVLFTLIYRYIGLPCCLRQ